jgi:type III restriction enzyme
MAMLIAWHTLNKVANRQDRRFSDMFLVVTPGITIRDRLRVLLPNEPDNFYRSMDVVPPDRMEELQRAVVEITNYHAFLQRDKVEAARLTKAILTRGSDGSALRETPEEVARRVCRAFGAKRGVVVINDEAHHCYRHKLEVETNSQPQCEVRGLRRWRRSFLSPQYDLFPAARVADEG